MHYAAESRSYILFLTPPCLSDFTNLDLGGFCVYPLPWCPHIEGIKENWPQTIWYDSIFRYLGKVKQTEIKFAYFHGLSFVSHLLETMQCIQINDRLIRNGFHIR